MREGQNNYKEKDNKDKEEEEEEDKDNTYFSEMREGQNIKCRRVEFYHIQIYLHIICCRYINIKYVSIKSILIFIYLYLVVLKCRLCILSVHILLNQLWFILPQTRVIVVGGWVEIWEGEDSINPHG